MKNRRALFTLIVACFVLPGLSRLQTSAQTVQVFQGPEVEDFLKRAKFTGMKDIPEGVTLPKKATLELDGVKRYGVWKTIDESAKTKQLDRTRKLSNYSAPAAAESRRSWPRSSLARTK